MEEKKQKDLQNKLLEGQYIKQWHQNRFDKTKGKKKNKRLKYFLDVGHFPLFFLFLPCRLQNNNKKRKINKKNMYLQCIYLH